MTQSTKRGIQIFSAIAFFAAGCILTYFWVKHTLADALSPSPASVRTESVPCELNSTRLHGYEFIRPLIFVDPSCESPNLAGIKGKLSEQINQFKADGVLQNASVYLRTFNSGEWTGVNINTRYHPGSLLKVPILIAYLRLASADPSVLDRKYTFEKPKDKELPVQNYKSKTLQEGQAYTVRELLKYAISYSDNNAHYLLSKHLDNKVLEKVFIDLGIGVPTADPADGLIWISPREYSAFMKTLFNSSYLNPDLSEFALSLLNQTTFEQGLTAGVPKGTKIAHKFGEWDDTRSFELHESGIIYIDNKPCLITIMTKGSQRDSLPRVISALTATIYSELKGS